MNRKNYHTDFLFVTPSFFQGMGTVFNIGGKFFEYNYSDSGLEADERAIESDWGVVGLDIHNSIQSFSSKLKNQEILHFPD
jgi:hypothetical protein